MYVCMYNIMCIYAYSKCTVHDNDRMIGVRFLIIWQMYNVIVLCAYGWLCALHVCTDRLNHEMSLKVHYLQLSQT